MPRPSIGGCCSGAIPVPCGSCILPPTDLTVSIEYNNDPTCMVGFPPVLGGLITVPLFFVPLAPGIGRYETGPVNIPDLYELAPSCPSKPWFSLMINCAHFPAKWSACFALETTEAGVVSLAALACGTPPVNFYATVSGTCEPVALFFDVSSFHFTILP